MNAPRPLLLSLLVAFAASALPALAQEGRYEVQGVGPEGSYQGNAWIQRAGKRDFRVALRAFDTRARERRFEEEAKLEGSRLALDTRDRVDGTPTERSEQVALTRKSARDLVVTYRDAQGEVTRREVWTRQRGIQVPVVVVALTGGKRFPGVSAAQAREAQKRVLAQLELTYQSLDASFRALRQPVPLRGERFDTDNNGWLSRRECVRLRDTLEQLKIKQPGRVVLVLTAASFVRPGCRGWTSGDAPQTPTTLTDLNDNVSLIGVSYLDPTRFHTTAHEVGHQLGLDDLRAQNRGKLEQPARRDHLMESGGKGIHLDPAIDRLLRRNLYRSIDFGLEGRQAPAAVGIPLRHQGGEGLPTPPALPRKG